MKTGFRNYRLLIGCSVLSLMLSACVTERHDALRASAERLDDVSAHFVTQVRYRDSDTRRERLTRDAEVLSRYAHKLDVDLVRGETRATVTDDYRQVEESYEELHRQLADEGYAEQDHAVLENFDRVTDAYHEVQSAIVMRTADTDIR